MAVPNHSQPRPLRESLPDYKAWVADAVRPATPDRGSRSSFSSIRETDSDLAQTFTSSKVSSSALEPPEDAVDISSPRAAMVETQFSPPLTHPESKLHGYWSPADSFRGWKQINVRGKLASKSFGDLQMLNLAWTTTDRPVRKKGVCAPGEAPFEKLPIELLSKLTISLIPPEPFPPQIPHPPASYEQYC